VDANGRLHRWLFHHALALARFNPPGLIFRSASRFYQRIEAYRAVLESVSAPFLPLIEWQPTALGNVEVLNDTSDLYRYFDATAHAEFLYACVEQVIEVGMPAEIHFLEAFDAFSERVQQIVDMPTNTVELLRAFLAQNGGAPLEARAHRGVRGAEYRRGRGGRAGVRTDVRRGRYRLIDLRQTIATIRAQPANPSPQRRPQPPFCPPIQNGGFLALGAPALGHFQAVRPAPSPGVTFASTPCSFVLRPEGRRLPLARSRL
jgi:hypothetical protein